MISLIKSQKYMNRYRNASDEVNYDSEVPFVKKHPITIIELEISLLCVTNDEQKPKITKCSHNSFG